MKTEFDIGEEAYLKVEVREIVVTTDKKVAYALTTVDKHRAIGRVFEEELRASHDEETEFVPIIYDKNKKDGYGYDTMICKKCKSDVGTDFFRVHGGYNFCPFCGRRVKIVIN